jgi:hypothetical protein
MRPAYEIAPFEIHYHTKDAAGHWGHERLRNPAYSSREERDDMLETLQRHAGPHIEYWAATNQQELDRQLAAKVRSGYDHNAGI